MTPDEIRALPAGRELDALVAEKVMGWERRQESWYDEEGVEGTSWYMPGETSPSAQAFGWHDDCDYEAPSSWGIPHYSTDIAAAWEVVEKMGKPFGLYWHPEDREHFSASFVQGPDYDEYKEAGRRTGHAETASLATCRAALLAVLVKGAVLGEGQP